MHRRAFLKTSAAAGATLAGLAPAVSRAGAALDAGDRVRVAVVGLHGRGNNLLRTFARLDDVDVRWVCDVDSNVLKRRQREISEGTRHRPGALSDFRRALDDRSVDAVVVGTPDHWHAIVAILACQAGKDVYVEKPDGHGILEGQRMVAAARKHRRVVQLGTQARSASHMREAMAWIGEGHLGEVRFAKAWESARQGSLGHPADSEPPAGVDYDMWLGPAPERPFNRLRFHSSWRWFFDYGTGDLGNDGVHRLDYALWGLKTALAARGKELPAFPRVVSSHGGKLYFDDAQEWPDTLMTTYDFGVAVLTYEMRIWTPYPLHGLAEGAAVLGDRGYVILGNSGWSAWDERGRRRFEKKGQSNLDASLLHARNFVDCMRSRERPAADLETVGHPSSLLCHVGNAAWRHGRSVAFDARTHTFIDDPEANRYRSRGVYRKPWVLPEVEA